MKREMARGKLLTRRALLLAGGPGRRCSARWPGGSITSRWCRPTATRCWPTRTASASASSRRRAAASSTASAWRSRRTARPIAPCWCPTRPATSRRRSTPSTGSCRSTDGDRRRVLRDIRIKHGFVPVVIKREHELGRDGAHRGQHARAAGVSIEQGRSATIPLADKLSRTSSAMSRRCPSRSCTATIRCSSCPTSASARAASRRPSTSSCAAPPAPARSRSTPSARWCASWRARTAWPGRRSCSASTWRCRTSRCSAAPSRAAPPCVALDAWTGEVLAMASTPGYDPGAFAAGLTSAEWQKLVTDPLNPLSDKAISGVYAPGSTFKPMVRHGGARGRHHHARHRALLSRACSRSATAVFHCWKKGGHGTLSLHRAHPGIRATCSSIASPTCSASTRSRRWRTASGSASMLGIEIPGEKTGLIPTRAWKLATTGVTWQRGDTISCGIGQGYVAVTPLQLATYVARLATGPDRRAAPGARAGRDGERCRRRARLQPRFRADGRQRRAFRCGAARACGRVVNEARGTRLSRAHHRCPAWRWRARPARRRSITSPRSERDKGIVTGTSVPWKDRDHALFIAFAPASAPRYACAVVVEHGGADRRRGRRGRGADRARRAARGAAARSRAQVPPVPYGAPARVAQELTRRWTSRSITASRGRDSPRSC